MKVTKRNGQQEELNEEKINKVLEWAVDGITGVSASDIAMNAQIQFFPGIKTEQIHTVLIQSAVDMISEKTPNYQWVAGNLLNYLIRKQIFEVKTNEAMPHLWNVITKNIALGVYDSTILEWWQPEDVSILNLYIKHKRDYEFTYAGIQQLLDKYLVKDRSNGQLYETPQYAYMLIAMTVFMKEPNRDLRLERVKKCYDLMTTQKISLPTPVIAGIRTPTRQYSSCTLIKAGDSLDSIIYANAAITKYVSKRAGIGIHAGSIRAKGSKIRTGEVVHTGLIPFLKQMESSVHSCSQGGLRRGSATIHISWWHKEIEDILVLKNNKGTDDNRVRHIDYSICFSKLFFQRVLEGKDVALFSPHDVKDMQAVFGKNEEFDKLYLKYEKDKSINKKWVKAQDLMTQFITERIGTARIYAFFADNANTNSPFKELLEQSNLCQEVVLPVKEMTSIYDIDSEAATETLSEGEVALCVLAGHNLGKIKTREELYECSEYMVRICDFIISHQEYPINAAKKMLKRRSIGCGVVNFAYWLAKNDLKYSDPASLPKIDELFEHIQWSLLDASCKLAEEQGKCEWFHKTTYADGILPIDRYNKNVDKLFTRQPECDWEGLRTRIKQHGLRNSVLSCIFPAESNSVVQNATQGIDPMRTLVSSRKSNAGIVKMVAPEAVKLKNKYELAFDMPDNTGYTNICATIQKWIDQSISANHFYKWTPEGTSVTSVTKDVLYAYKMGLKTLYYANNDDKRDIENAEEDTTGCESGACSL